MRVVVFGATGDQGQAQLRRLAAAGHEPVAAARDPDRIRGLGFDRIATAAADYRDAASLAAALDGADAVFVTLPSSSFQSAESVIAAADAVGRAAAASPTVRLCVFNSSMIVKDRPYGFAAHDARFEMRRRLFDTLPAIAIQPVIYLDNLLRAWARPSIVQEGLIAYPHRETLDVSWICQDDAADLMIAALGRPDLAGRGFNVGGPEAIRGPDLARRLGAVLGRPLRFESLPIPAFCERMQGIFAGVSSLERKRLIGELDRIYSWYNESPERPFFVDMAEILKELPVRLTALEDWAGRQDWSADEGA